MVIFQVARPAGVLGQLVHNGTPAGTPTETATWLWGAHMGPQRPTPRAKLRWLSLGAAGGVGGWTPES
jgi:hypothetical protein